MSRSCQSQLKPVGVTYQFTTPVHVYNTWDGDVPLGTPSFGEDLDPDAGFVVFGGSILVLHTLLRSLGLILSLRERVTCMIPLSRQYPSLVLLKSAGPRRWADIVTVGSIRKVYHNYSEKPDCLNYL